MDLNIRGVESEFVVACKSEALRSGKSLKQWVVEILTEATNGNAGRTSGTGHSGSDNKHKVLAGSNETASGGSSASGVTVQGRKTEDYPVPSGLKETGPEETTTAEGVNDCPECGKEMVWNKTMKRMECQCGFKGKVKR